MADHIAAAGRYRSAAGSRAVDLVLVGLFLAAAAAVAVSSYISPVGLLTADSALYLRFARALQAGYGFHSGLFKSGIDQPGELRPFFAVWPAGYPVLIAAASWVTGLDVFWASKLVNILALGGGMLVLRAVFGPAALAPACALLFAPVLETVSWTFSEAPFIAVLLAFVWCLARFDRGERPVADAAAVAVAALALFLLRYIGGVAFLVAGLGVLLALWRRRWRDAVALTGALGVAAALCGLYLLNNYWETGLATGTLRTPNLVPVPELLGRIAVFLWGTLNPVVPGLGLDARGLLVNAVVIGGPALLLLLLARRPGRRGRGSSRGLGRGFAGWGLATALVMLVAMVGLRLRAHFDIFDVRFFAPILLLLTLWLFDAVLRRGGRAAGALAGVALLLAAGSLGWNVARPAAAFVAQGWPSYLDLRERERARLAALPADAIYVYGFGRYDLFYLFPELAIAHPRPLLRGGQGWDEFLASLTAFGRPVYASDDWGPLSRFDPSIGAYYTAHIQGRGLVRVR